jgi:signal transduction histidine kinase
MPTNRPHARPIAIIVATILILGAAIYAVLMTIARVGDAHQRVIEQRVIESALDQQRTKLAGMMVQQAYWDAAYDAVGAHTDIKWVDTNLGFSAETAGVPVTAILDARGRVVYRFTARADRNQAADLQSSSSLARLGLRAQAAPALPPASRTAFVHIGKAEFLGAAQRIVPNDARAAHPLSRHYVLIYLLPVDSALLRGFQSGFDVAPLALSRSPRPGRARVALVDADGVPLAWLSWHSARPGEDFANAAAPFAIGCFILLAALQLIVLRWWMQTARRMHDESMARTAFMANISHELRTPLNAIIGFSDCMVGEMFGPLSARYREYAHDIKTSGQLLLGLVNDVLDLTHLNNAADIPMAPVRMGDSLDGAVRMLREYAKADGISVDYVDSSDGAEVAANEKSLSQILLNLGSNAVKFSPVRSSIDVLLSRGPDCVELVVRDRGVGIPPERLRLVGQPFYQAHPGVARKPGSGLGLAIVKKLTERLGGDFTIVSAVGAGTTVTVRLPRLRSASDPDRARAA